MASRQLKTLLFFVHLIFALKLKCLGLKAFKFSARSSHLFQTFDYEMGMRSPSDTLVKCFFRDLLLPQTGFFHMINRLLSDEISFEIRRNTDLSADKIINIYLGCAE